jgi:hypothetical protein
VPLNVLCEGMWVETDACSTLYALANYSMHGFLVSTSILELDWRTECIWRRISCRGQNVPPKDNDANSGRSVLLIANAL